MTHGHKREGVTWARRTRVKHPLQEYRTGRMGMDPTETHARHVRKEPPPCAES